LVLVDYRNGSIAFLHAPQQMCISVTVTITGEAIREIK